MSGVSLYVRWLENVSPFGRPCRLSESPSISLALLAYSFETTWLVESVTRIMQGTGPPSIQPFVRTCSISPRSDSSRSGPGSRLRSTGFLDSAERCQCARVCVCVCVVDAAAGRDLRHLRDCFFQMYSGSTAHIAKSQGLRQSDAAFHLIRSHRPMRCGTNLPHSVPRHLGPMVGPCLQGVTGPFLGHIVPWEGDLV